MNLYSAFLSVHQSEAIPLRGTKESKTTVQQNLIISNPKEPTRYMYIRGSK